MITFLRVLFLPGLLIATSCTLGQQYGSMTTEPAGPAHNVEAGGAWGLRIRTASETFSVRQDGSTRKNLPHIPVRGEFSPDNTRILSVGLERGQDELYVSDALGKNRRKLTHKNPVDSVAHWAPDSKRIIFSSAQGGIWQVYLMDADGKNIQRLTSEEPGAWKAQYSHDGRIAYLAWRSPLRDGKPPLSNDLIVTDGKNSKVIVENKPIASFAWSRNGEAIAYSYLGSESKLVVHSLLTGTAHDMLFTDIDSRLNGHVAYDIHWRPDGQALACRIKFVGGRAEDSPLIFGDREVFVIGLDGKSKWLQVDPAAAVDWITMEEGTKYASVGGFSVSLQLVTTPETRMTCNDQTPVEPNRSKSESRRTAF